MVENTCSLTTQEVERTCCLICFPWWAVVALGAQEDGSKMAARQSTVTVQSPPLLHPTLICQERPSVGVIPVF